MTVFSIPFYPFKTKLFQQVVVGFTVFFSHNISFSVHLLQLGFCPHPSAQILPKVAKKLGILPTPLGFFSPFILLISVWYLTLFVISCLLIIFLSLSSIIFWSLSQRLPCLVVLCFFYCRLFPCLPFKWTSVHRPSYIFLLPKEISNSLASNISAFWW